VIAGAPSRGGQRGQATVEVALVLPVVVLLLLVVVQAGLLVRDRVLLVQATRAAARVVVVAPDAGAARAEAARVLPGPFSLAIGGDRSPGGLATVTTRTAPTRVPLVGYAVAGIRLEEHFVVRVEGR
jgi:Flp pilus assembly protein TadG